MLQYSNFYYFLFLVLKLYTSKDSAIAHNIFIKEHAVRQITPEKPAGKTLFVLNIPPYITKQNLKDIFQSAGPVKSVLFAEKATQPTIPDPLKPSPFFPQKELFKFKIAFIIFETSTALDNALELDKLPPVSTVSELITGVAKWKQQLIQKMPNNDEELQNDIDSYMSNYDASEEKKAEIEKNLNGTDSNGWVTVGKKGINAGFEQKESVVNKLQAKIAEGKKKKELVNFYSFQIRESKMKKIINLRRKFDQDKQKIEDIKKTRRFKPF